MKNKAGFRRFMTSLLLTFWILLWTWAVGYFDWTSENRAVAFFFFFSIEVFLLDRGYRWIRPKTDLSISAGLGMLMLYTGILVFAGTVLVSAYRPDALFPTIWRTINGASEFEMRPVTWALITGIFHSLVLGLMGMTVLIWRRPFRNS